MQGTAIPQPPLRKTRNPSHIHGRRESLTYFVMLFLCGGRLLVPQIGNFAKCMTLLLRSRNCTAIGAKNMGVVGASVQ